MPPVPPPLPPEAPAPALSAKPPTHEIASAKPALVRAGEELSSDKVSELPAGTRVTVLETGALSVSTLALGCATGAQLLLRSLVKKPSKAS